MRVLTWHYILVLLLLSTPFLPAGIAANWEDPAQHCLAAYERLLFFQEKGSNQLPLTARSFKTDEGEQWIYGVSVALENADTKILKAAPFIRTLIGQSTPEVEIATAVAGSITRTAKTGGFSDLDMEALWIIKTAPKREKALSSPSSSEILTLTQNFKKHIDKTLQENPKIRFIELKAGEFTDPADHHIKGIKWSLEDIRAGFKTIHEPNRTRKVTLEKAFSENARIKADWAIPSIQDSAPTGAYQEASVLYRVGMQVGRNQPRLRSVPQNEVLPLRRTAVSFGPEEVSLLREVSNGASSVSLEEVHRKMLEGLVKNGAPEPLKLLKRLYGLLAFWEAPEQVGLSAGRAFSREKLEAGILKILNDPAILKLNQLKSHGELFAILEEHGITAPDQSREKWLDQIKISNQLDTTIKSLSNQLNQRVNQFLSRQDDLSAYVEILKNRIPLTLSSLYPHPLFISIQPSKKWLDRYESNRKVWIKKYPALTFSLPQDVHMTLHFSGRLTEPMIDRIKDELPPVSKRWRFSDGGAHIFGKENDVIAISFNTDYNTLVDLNTLRSRAIALGARADLEHPLLDPHVTLARFNPSSRKAQKDREKFLQNETLQGLHSVEMKKAGLFSRDPKSKKGQPSYLHH